MNNKIIYSIIPFQVIVVLICFFINFTDGFDLVAMAVAAPIISSEMNLPPSTLGAIFSSALFGMAVGSMFLAPLSDKFGRRIIILFSIAIISTTMIIITFAHSLYQLLALRFITGIGIGGVLASSTSMVSEFVPKHRSALAVIFCASGFTVGTIIVGPLAAMLIEEHGWRSLFICGGIFGYITLFLVYFMLPESMEFLSSSSGDKNIRLAKINKSLSLMGKPLLTSLPHSQENSATKNSVAALFSEKYRKKTFFLWGLFFATYWTSYFLINWIPQLFVLSGSELKQSIHALTALTLGGLFGAWFLGFFSSKFKLNRIIALTLLSAAILIGSYALRQPAESLVILIYMLAIGFTLNGGLTALYAIAAEMYPLDIRATGVGWGIGIGRIGAIMSPIIAGALVENGWGLYNLFLALAMPAALLAAYLATKTK